MIPVLTLSILIFAILNFFDPFSLYEEKKVETYPAPISLSMYKGPNKLTVAEFQTSRGDFCVAVATAGFTCDWKGE